MNDVRILTLWQPWASLIALNLKRYETRSWGVSYRGKLLIHAAKRPICPYECQAILDHAQETNHSPLWDALCNINAQPNYGCIVAIADLIEYQRMISITGYEAANEIGIPSINILEKAVGNWDGGRYAWKLKNVIALPEPIAYKGGQGLRMLTNEQVLKKIDALVR